MFENEKEGQRPLEEEQGSDPPEQGETAWAERRSWQWPPTSPEVPEGRPEGKSPESDPPEHDAPPPAPASPWGGPVTAEPPDTGPSTASRLNMRRLAIDAIETLLLAALIFLAVRLSFQNFRVEGVSMFPSLQDGEYLIVNKLAYLKVDLSALDWVPFFDPGDHPGRYIFGSPKRGDVVVFHSPDRPERDFIKRIIGLPGDTVSIDGASGRVYVNGLPLEEPYVRGRTQCSATLMGCGPWVVPAGHYFVLGDNREQSTDSRFFGFVPEESIVGKALITYWPPEDFGLAPNHSVSFAGQ